MEKLELSIDGQKVAVTPGTVVLDAALQAGIYIPNLCYHPDLKPYGGCRLCMVEIEGLRGPVTSCSTEVAQDMVVRTSTPEIEAGRRVILEMILARHPTPCLVCRKNQTCPLREAAAHLGVSGDSVPADYGALPVDDSPPAFYFDPNRCCFCARCVRTCEEIRGLGALSFIYRGYDSFISSFGSGGSSLIADSNCDGCLECVKRCPVNALMPKEDSGMALSLAATQQQGSPMKDD